MCVNIEDMNVLNNHLSIGVHTYDMLVYTVSASIGMTDRINIHAMKCKAIDDNFWYCSDVGLAVVI